MLDHTNVPELANDLGSLHMAEYSASTTSLTASPEITKIGKVKKKHTTFLYLYRKGCKILITVTGDSNLSELSYKTNGSMFF